MCMHFGLYCSWCGRLVRLTEGFPSCVTKGLLEICRNRLYRLRVAASSHEGMDDSTQITV